MAIYTSITKKTISFILLSLSIIDISQSADTCVNQLESCKQDCDCCGFGTESGIVCQTRDHDSGPRCYTFRSHGEPCIENSQCKSQQCANGICQPRAHLTINKPELCPITYPTDDLTAVIGELTSDENSCPCQDADAYPEGSEPEKVLKAGAYVNNYPINAGFLVRPSYHYPLRKLVICTSDEDPAYDPQCFKIEGRCKGYDEYNILMEGTLDLPLERKKCIRVHIEDQNEKARPEYDQLKITFPCQRGGFDQCTEGCQNYPVIIDQVALLGNCRDRNVCKVDARVFYDIGGTTWSPPEGTCPSCELEMDSPIGNGPGKTVDESPVPYINYKSVGSAIVYEGVEKAIHTMRIFPADSDNTASSPISYEIYASTDKQKFELMSSGSIVYPVGVSDTENFAEIEWDNEVHYEVIKVVFPEVEGSFDTVCSGDETCKDYPLVVGEIEFFGWC